MIELDLHWKWRSHSKTDIEPLKFHLVKSEVDVNVPRNFDRTTVSREVSNIKNQSSFSLILKTEGQS